MNTLVLTDQLNVLVRTLDACQERGQIGRKRVKEIRDSSITWWWAHCRVPWDFFLVFDPITQRKMEQMLREYGFPKEKVTAIMMVYKNTKAMVHSLDGDINFFDNISGDLQGSTLAAFLFIICLDYILWIWIDLIKRNSFTLKKTSSKKQWYLRKRN